MRSRPRSCVLLSTDLVFRDGRFEPTTPPRSLLPLVDVVAVDDVVMLVSEAPVPEVVQVLGGSWTDVTIEVPEPITRAVWSDAADRDDSYVECAALLHVVHSGELECAFETSPPRRIGLVRSPDDDAHVTSDRSAWRPAPKTSFRASRVGTTTQLWCRYGFDDDVERAARALEAALLGPSFRVDPEPSAHVLVWTDAPPNA